MTLNKAFDKQSNTEWRCFVDDSLEFYEGEFTSDKIASIMMKAGLNGVFAS